MAVTATEARRITARDVAPPVRSIVTEPAVALRGLSDMRRYFLRSERPIFFVGPTNFNLLGMEEWCGNFHHVNYIDCYDARHPGVFVPCRKAHPEFDSIEAINNHLLQDAEVIEYLHSFGREPVAVFLMFDETTEKLARDIGVEIWLPPAGLRHRLDNKINTVRIGNEAGVLSVPNVLSEVTSYEQLRAVAADLGPDLVVQTAYGDSGHTTYFISSEADFARHADEIRAAGEVKIMKRVRCRSAAIEACVTRRGTIVGPLMTELVGFPELTPYRGGWCGNEVFADSFTEEVRRAARERTSRFGEQLRREGYRGYFELDFLVDADTGELHLGELNPRITGASSLTNNAAFAHADAPLFLFHLLEFSDVEFDLDVEELNARWAAAENIDGWAQLVIKHTGSEIRPIAAAPQSGIWRLGDSGVMSYERFDYRPRAVTREDEGFFLRISDRGDWAYEGADLGILVTRGRLMTDDFQLNARARQWVAGIRGLYAVEPEAAVGPPIAAPGWPTKML